MEKGAEDSAEHGLGAAEPTADAQAPTGAPVTAQGYAGTLGGLRREAEAKQGGNTVQLASSLMKQ